jgi:hypothetical protein
VRKKAQAIIRQDKQMPAGPSQTIFARQKFSGGYPAAFGQFEGAEIFCRIRNYLLTCFKRDIKASHAWDFFVPPQAAIICEVKAVLLSRIRKLMGLSF